MTERSLLASAKIAVRRPMTAIQWMRWLWRGLSQRELKFPPGNSLQPERRNGPEMSNDLHKYFDAV